MIIEETKVRELPKWEILVAQETHYKTDYKYRRKRTHNKSDKLFNSDIHMFTYGNILIT